MTNVVQKKKELEVPAQMFDTLISSVSGVQRAKEEGKPVVWSSILIPKEIFHAMDVAVVYIELVSIAMSLMQLSGKYCQVAEEVGFSRDVCAAHRCFIGCAAAEERDPFLESIFAPPDLIIATNLPCMSESKSLLFSASRFNCPYMLIDTPLNPWKDGEVPDHAIEYYADQLQEAIHFMEKHGYKLDWERLKETVELSRRLMLIWDKVDGYKKAIPTPIGPADSLWCAIGSWLLEPKQAIEIFESLCEELKERVENKVGVLDDEKLRLYFFGVPIIYNMEMMNYPEKYGAVIVKDWLEYLLIGAFDPRLMDPEKPLESLALKTITNLTNPPMDNMLDFTVESAKDFNVDGVISVVKRSCGLVPGMTRPLKDAIYDQTGIPSTIFDLDGIDTREQDDVTAQTNIDSFIETLLASKRRS
jgi:benzoyl-CoA reductase/2-hydroxyglutaryl-CoA dehydratase subunit BcrC/BadD/HgdB